MAGWALTLAVIGVCVPVLPGLVAVVLAVAVLRRSRDGRDHGRGMAIAALVVTGAGLVLQVLVGAWVALVVGADTSDPVRARATEPETTTPVERLEVGDCLDDETLARLKKRETKASANPDTVPCLLAHQFEVYATFDLDDANGWPGDKAVARLAKSGCSERLDPDFLKVPQARHMGLYLYLPTKRSWRGLDDRRVVCLAGYPGRTTGSLVQQAGGSGTQVSQPPGSGTDRDGLGQGRI